MSKQKRNIEKKFSKGLIGRTMLDIPKLTPREKTVQEILLKFMEDNGQGGCPAFSPDFLLQNIKPQLKEKGIERVGKSALESVFTKSAEMFYDSKSTGTVFRLPKASVSYKLEPNLGFEFNKGTIGGTSISPGEGTINVLMASNLRLPVEVNYGGIVEWSLTIKSIELENGVVLELRNESGYSYQVINNSVIKGRGAISEECLETNLKSL
ncbi:hypothetical protein [Tenacibaculum xiamenense]|uniref:hypothetical protein n=1 Tax=Tenacibaculum xiamenense TaxID=1261553 RepID=UPI003892F6FB